MTTKIISTEDAVERVSEMLAEVENEIECGQCGEYFMEYVDLSDSGIAENMTDEQLCAIIDGDDSIYDHFDPSDFDVHEEEYCEDCRSSPMANELEELRSKLNQPIDGAVRMSERGAYTLATKLGVLMDVEGDNMSKATKEDLREIRKQLLHAGLYKDIGEVYEIPVQEIAEKGQLRRKEEAKKREAIAELAHDPP